MSLARAHDMGLDSLGKGIFVPRQTKIIFGMNQAPVGALGNPQRAFRVIFPCVSDGTILGTPKSFLLCFTAEARPYLIGRCHKMGSIASVHHTSSDLIT